MELINTCLLPPQISSCIDMGFVAHYINTTVSSTFSVAERSTIIQSWVDAFPSARSNELLQAALLSSVVLPVLEAAHKAGQADELLGQGLVDQLVKQVLVPTDELTVQTGGQTNEQGSTGHAQHALSFSMSICAVCIVGDAVMTCCECRMTVCDATQDL